jgi:hypothetical protein
LRISLKSFDAIKPAWANGEYYAEEVFLRACDRDCRNRHIERRFGRVGRAAQGSKGDVQQQLPISVSSYAFAPQSVSANSRYGQCWIATDANRPYGYMDSCANPLAYDPALNPVYDATLHGD